MKIYEVLERDPRTAELANKGQARITSETGDKATQELRAELESFVCGGEFGRSLARMLQAYLTNLGEPRQGSVWVSGFFGSGKSHLLKMLAHLWANTSFPDGAKARSLVPHLPEDIRGSLRELDTRARQLSNRPPLAAAGTLLGGTDHVRLTVLSIILRACGWPVLYAQARFCSWLRDEGVLQTVRERVESTGKKWADELNNLYVSPVIGKALFEAYPSLAENPKAVLQLLRAQFQRPATDITTDEFVELAKKALAPKGSMPLIVLVLDEVQQYISEGSDRAKVITELTEAVQTQMSSRVLLVASGQSALSAGTQALQWLTDRFQISVQLTDAEVEAVTRQVLLRKKLSTTSRVKGMLDESEGEVSRHLRGTSLARSEDRRHQVDDYPLLPARRRFWEACFESANISSTHGQLRSQLRILHDSLRKIAGYGLGSVIPASDLYGALAQDLVNSGALPSEIATRIARLDDGTGQGRRSARTCAAWPS